ncbi:MAG: hypothetical protein JW874_09300 [Spirochaetales bacterium]|nr:hypothetical protein [Spirochaetales bacterium]
MLQKNRNGSVWIIARGNYNSDSVDNYIARQKDLGIDLIVTEIRKQLDEWHSNSDL